MKTSSHSSKNKISGFTIIEIIIVLAIAGSLIVVVLTVASQAQKSRRDTQRKSYVQSVYQSLLEYTKNNGYIPTCIDKPDPPPATSYTRVCGTAPQDAEKFVSNYIPSGTDPSSGEDYLGSTTSDNGQTITSGKVKYHYNASSVDHEYIPTPGSIEIGTGHWCASSRVIPGYPNWVISSETPVGSHPATEQGKYYILMGLERGAYYCLDNYSAG